MTEEIYSEAYFSSASFDQDYASIADAIVRAYRPATVLDVGCGPGHLSRALAARGAQVVALDFYSKPDFGEARISFYRCDLNSRDDLRTFSLAFPRLFDVAVCLEVVAHLKPEISDDVVDFLCKRARAVVFSPAVPGQGGLGQINCQPREAWHERFVRQRFQLVHRVRPSLIANSELASWFRFNILDYSTSGHAVTQHTEPVHSLLQVDSILTSEFFIQRRELSELRRERDAVLRDRDAVLGSRSWRWTAPLRALRQSRSWRRLTAPLCIVVNTCRALAHQRPAMQRQRVEEKTTGMNEDKPTIGVIIVTCGEPQFEACCNSVNAQSLRPDRIDIVRDVYPMSAAFNEVLRLLSCDYSVKVDADMVLDPHALETLYNDINSSADNVFGIGYRLRDPYYGPVGHIKIYKSRLLRSRRVDNESGYDRVLVNEMKKEGYLMLERAQTLGVHLPNPTPKELFKRALGTAKRSLKFGDSNNMIKHMARRWCDEDDKVALAGLIGYCGGLLLEYTDEEKDFRTFGTKEWSSIKWMFAPASQKLP